MVCIEKSFFVLYCATNSQGLCFIYLFILIFHFRDISSEFVNVATVPLFSQECCYHWCQLKYLLAYLITDILYINISRHLMIQQTIIT